MTDSADTHPNETDAGSRPPATAMRRRTRQATPRPHVIKFCLTDAEHRDLIAAAGRINMALGAYAAEATMAAARQLIPGASEPLRHALLELIRAAGLVRRIGVNLNQAVAKLNTTGEPPGELLPISRHCARVVANLDRAAEQLRRRIT